MKDEEIANATRAHLLALGPPRHEINGSITAMEIQVFGICK
jgi:hypothetical protein